MQGQILVSVNGSFKAPNGKHFTVRDLADALSKFEGSNSGDHGDHTIFEGLQRVSPGTYQAMWIEAA